MLRLFCALKPLLCKSAEKRGSAAVDNQLSNTMGNIIIPVVLI